jgi:hypothetical protein
MHKLDVHTADLSEVTTTQFVSKQFQVFLVNSARMTHFVF